MFTHDMVTHARVIVHLAQRYSGKRWLEYDKIKCALQALEDHYQDPPSTVHYKQRLRHSPLDDVC